MKITPSYPKGLLKQPYYRGVVTGVMIGIGLEMMIHVSLIHGLILFVIGTFLYYKQTRDDYNFI